MSGSGASTDAAPSAGVADLHVHTTASDGTVDVETRIEQAREDGLDALAVTDHDRIPDALAGPVTRADGLEVVTGVELRADVLDTKVELLGYYLDPANDRLADALERARRYRSERNRDLVERVTDATALEASYEELRARADGQLGRPDVAAALVDAGEVDSIGEAFAEYLGPDGDAFVPMERVSHETALDAIHAAGGVASLAHPGRIRSDRIEDLLSRLADVGLDGIEVWYPYGDVRSEEYADVGVSDAADFADRYDLLATGGSDCHGPGSGKFRLGDVRTPASALASLRAAATSVDPHGGGDR